MDITGDVVSIVEPAMLPDAAVIIVLPVSILARASPWVLIVAMAVSDESHTTKVVRFREVLLEYLPIALN